MNQIETPGTLLSGYKFLLQIPVTQRGAVQYSSRTGWRTSLRLSKLHNWKNRNKISLFLHKLDYFKYSQLSVLVCVLTRTQNVTLSKAFGCTPTEDRALKCKKSHWIICRNLPEGLTEHPPWHFCIPTAPGYSHTSSFLWIIQYVNSISAIHVLVVFQQY